MRRIADRSKSALVDVCVELCWIVSKLIQNQVLTFEKLRDKIAIVASENTKTTGNPEKKKS